jgi:uncharacterized membrane protein
MRKWLEGTALAGLAWIVWVTWQAFNGPDPLPERVPTHFDAAGNANAWGPPSTLWLLPVVAVALYLLISVISLFHTGIKSAARLTAESRARVEALTRQMVSWLKVELAGFFACLQWFILSTVRRGAGSIPKMVTPVFLVVVFASVAWHIAAILRALRTESN